MAVAVEADFGSGVNDCTSLAWECFHGVTRDEPGDFVGDGMFLEEAEEAVNADFGAEDSGAVVGKGVVLVVAGAEVA